LRQAVEKMPDHLAANWLLVLTTARIGEFGKSSDLAVRLNHLPVRSAEECLYKGIWLGFYAPEEALPLLNQAIAGRGSLLVLAYRAIILAIHAHNQNDFTRMQDAMDDVKAARRVSKTRDNPTALALSVYVHQYAAVLYAQNQKKQQAEDALRAARDDAEALARFPTIPRAV
jgi:hypothetical protein